MAAEIRLPLQWDSDQDLAYLRLGSLGDEEIQTVTCDIAQGSVLLVMDVGVSSHRIAGFEVVPASAAFSWMTVEQREDAIAKLEVDVDWAWADVRLFQDPTHPSEIVPFRCEGVPGVFGCIGGGGRNVRGFRIPDPKNRLPERLVAALNRDG